MTACSMKMMGALSLVAVGLFCVSGAMAQPRGIVAPDTGGVSYGLTSVNAVNRANAGVTRRPEGVQAGGAAGVNAVNIRYGGVKKRPRSLQADTPSTGMRPLAAPSGSAIIRY